ncbi:MAG: SPOR domain-containing protein [Taibaiella sp.]|nr:SPOR domain-containing protein [Taibaiella sp.]
MRFVFYCMALCLSYMLPIISAYSQEQVSGRVTIHSDARLAVLVSKTHSYVRPIRPEPPKLMELPPPPPSIGTYTTSGGLVHHDQKTVYKGKGYRVQIYYGPSREKAMAARREFMRRFPGVRSYIEFESPAFRVKVGDYRSRTDADGMLREANSMFSPSMIVPEPQVEISNF